jgi:hypothetical protein
LVFIRPKAKTYKIPCQCRRSKWIRDKQEEEQRIRDEELKRKREEQARQEEEKRFKDEEEYRKKKEMLDTIAAKQAEREREMERKLAEEKLDDRRKHEIRYFKQISFVTYIGDKSK